MTTTALPRSDGELELALLVEPFERELGGLRELSARGPLREVASLLRDERPHEQDEEQQHEPDRDALGDELRAVRHGYNETMKTGVPTSTWLNSHSASEMRMRTHPCEAEYPIEAASGVPWIPTYGAEMPIQRVPRGLPGPGGTGSASAAQSDGGGYHHGLRCMVTIS